MKIEKGKPLVLPNGAVIHHSGDGGGAEVMTIDEHAEKLVVDGALQEDVDVDIHAHRYERSLADLHADPKQMNTAMIVVAYTIWGLDSYAIGRVLNTTDEAVDTIKDTDLYLRLYEEVFEASRHIDQATVHGYLQGNALTAAKTVVKGLKSKSEDIKISSAKDILDRAGFRPADRVEHVMKFEDELRIRVIRDTPPPTIDVTPEI